MFTALGDLPVRQQELRVPWVSPTHPRLVPLAAKIGWIWAGSYLTELLSASALAKREADTGSTLAALVPYKRPVAFSNPEPVLMDILSIFESERFLCVCVYVFKLSRKTICQF